MTKKRVLVIATNDASLCEFIKFFEASNRVEPVFFMTYFTEQLTKLESNNWLVIGGRVNENNRNNCTAVYKIRGLIGSLLDNTALGVYCQVHIFREKLSNHLQNKIKNDSVKIELLLKEYDIDSCIIATDRSCGFEASLMYLSQRMNLKKMIMPFAIPADYNSSYKIRGKKIYSCNYQGSKHNLYKDKALGDRLFFRPFEHLALESLNIFPNNPWVLGGGCSDIMLVDSEREKQRLVSLGGDKDKYIVTGSVSHDILYETSLNKDKIKNRITYKYFTSTKRLLVISLPQYYEHGLCDKDTHCTIIKSLLSTVENRGWNVLVSLHPKMSKDDYEYIENDFDVAIASEPLSDVIVASDLFLATYSSTVSWALMCNIPVVVFDYISLDYDDFYSEFSIPIIKTNRDLALQLEYIENESCKSFKYQEVGSLSPFDGRCLSRMEDVICE